MRRSSLFISSTGGISEIGWDLRTETSRKAEATNLLRVRPVGPRRNLQFDDEPAPKRRKFQKKKKPDSPVEVEPAAKGKGKKTTKETKTNAKSEKMEILPGAMPNSGDVLLKAENYSRGKRVSVIWCIFTSYFSMFLHHISTFSGG